MVARRADLLEEVCEQAMERGAMSAEAHAVDIRNTEAMTLLASELNASTGGVDVLINNAGVAPVKVCPGFAHTEMLEAATRAGRVVPELAAVAPRLFRWLMRRMG